MTSRSFPGHSNAPETSSASVHTNANLEMNSLESSSPDSARQRKVLQKSDKILRKISQFLSESFDESASLQEECQKFHNSSKFECDDLTDCVNDDLASEMVKQVGKSVLKMRMDILEHFEQTADRMRSREETDKARNSRIQEAFERKKAQFEELDKKHALLLKENEGLKDELDVVSAELNSIRSESEVYVSNLEGDLEESKKSLDNVTADLTRATKALSSLSKDRNQLEEEVQNLKPLNENLTKEVEVLQKDVKTLQEDQALQREKEQLFSSLKSHMAKKLEEKEIIIAEKSGQLKVLKSELSREKQRAQTLSQSSEEDIITLDAPVDKKNRMLEQRVSEQRKKLVRCMREEERLKSELKQHRVNLTMIKSGINQLICDPTTSSSMIQSLKVLRHSSVYSLADTREGPLEKKVKLEGKGNVKEEYFEHVDAPLKCESDRDESSSDQIFSSLDVREKSLEPNIKVVEADIVDNGILDKERTEPDGPMVVESDEAQVDCSLALSSAGQDVNTRGQTGDSGENTKN